MQQEDKNPTTHPLTDGQDSPQKESGPGTPSSQALAPLERFALAVTNPTVISLSKAFNWKPETVIARVERALPEKFEQQVYLAVAESFRIRPESLALLLDIWRGGKPLTIHDLERRQIGQNVVANSFGNFSDFFEACMSLIKIVCKEYQAFGISMELAAHIVLAFGVNQPEALIEMIDTNLDECCEFFGVSLHRSYHERMRICTWSYIEHLLPKLREQGIPDVLDPSEFIGHEELRRHCIRQALDGEAGDHERIPEAVREILKGGIPK